MDKVKKYRREIAVGGSWYPQKNTDGSEVFVKTNDEYAELLNANSRFTKIRYVLVDDKKQISDDDEKVNLATANKETLLAECEKLGIEVAGDETNTKLRMMIKDKHLELK